MIGIPRALQVVGMAVRATQRPRREAARLRSGMTTFTRDGGVRADERETRARVIRERADRRPRPFVMTLDARRAEQATMRIEMTSAAAARREALHRPTVVVTAKAFGLRMRPDEREARFALVVKFEIRSDRMPAAARVAQRAIAGKRIVRHDRAALRVPVLRTHRPVRSSADDARQREAGHGECESCQRCVTARRGRLESS